MDSVSRTMQIVRLSALQHRLTTETTEFLVYTQTALTTENLTECQFKLMELKLVMTELRDLTMEDDKV